MELKTIRIKGWIFRFVFVFVNSRMIIWEIFLHIMNCLNNLLILLMFLTQDFNWYQLKHINYIKNMKKGFNYPNSFWYANDFSKLLTTNLLLIQIWGNYTLETFFLFCQYIWIYWIIYNISFLGFFFFFF